MDTSMNKDAYLAEMQAHNKEVRNLVMAGYEQAQQGQTESFDAVCERLEKKYSNAVIHD